MPLNLLGFVLGQTLALRENVSGPRAVQLGFVSAIMPSPLVGALVVQGMARIEGQAAQPVVLPPASSGGETIKMPLVTSNSKKTFYRDEAERELIKLGFTNITISEHAVRTAQPDVVIAQNPAPKAEVVPAETPVTLTVTPREK